MYTGGRAWLDGDTIFYTTGRTARDTKNYTGVPNQIGGDGSVLVTNFKGYLCGMGIVHWGSRMELRNIQVGIVGVAGLGGLWGVLWRKKHFPFVFACRDAPSIIPTHTHVHCFTTATLDLRLAANGDYVGHKHGQRGGCQRQHEQPCGSPRLSNRQHLGPAATDCVSVLRCACRTVAACIPPTSQTRGR